MKIKKFIAGMAAATMAISSFAISASATKLSDVAYPTEENAEVNDAFYSIGAMGFFMSQEWAWNQGDWVGISDDGKIEISYSISQVIADKTLSDKGSLGDMGIMIMNLPEGSYPYDITISDAKFVATDGTETKLDSINSITQAAEDAEGGFRIHIRPTDEVDEESGEVIKAACPEVAGWDAEGAFNGGVLSMTIDFGMPAAGTDDSSSKADDNSSKGDNNSSKKDDTSSKTDDSSSKKDNSSTAGTTSNKTNNTTTTTTGGTTSNKTAADADNSNAETGAESFAFAGVALAAAAVVISKKNK